MGRKMWPPELNEPVEPGVGTVIKFLRVTGSPRVAVRKANLYWCIDAETECKDWKRLLEYIGESNWATMEELS